VQIANLSGPFNVWASVGTLVMAEGGLGRVLYGTGTWQYQVDSATAVTVNSTPATRGNHLLQRRAPRLSVAERPRAGSPGLRV
jgi:hypothetical protein